MHNGDLLNRAEAKGYQLLITTDQNLPYQQNLAERRLAVLVLMSTSWPRLQRRITDIRAAIDGLAPGEVKGVAI